MSRLAFDNFQRSDENPLSGGGNWTTVTGLQSPQVVGGFCEASSASQCGCFYSGITWPADQYSEAVIAAFGFALGALVRCASGVKTYYRGIFNGETGATSLQMLNNGFQTIFGFGPTLSGSVGDQVKLQAQGTTISLFYNGVLQLSVTDSTIASGSAGLNVLQRSTPSDTQISEWDGGDFAAGGAPPEVYDPKHVVTPSPRGPIPANQATRIVAPRFPTPRHERR
jgi:hypothetical protein